MTALNDGIMKADRRGRLRYAPEQREALVKACLASGLSAPRFAAMHGVKYQTLATWIHQHKRVARPASPRLPPPPGTLLLIPAELDVPPSAAGIEVLLPGGAKLHVASQSAVPLAAALIRELTLPC
jgi:transposase-like protein